MPNFRWFYANKSVFKGLLFIIATLLIIAEVRYIQEIVKRLREDQREIVELSVSLYPSIAEIEEEENFSFLFDNVIRKINVPVIVSSPEGEPNFHARINDIKPPPYSPETIAMLKDMMAEMDKENSPKEILYGSEVINLIHFGDSELIKQLNWLPVVQVVTAGMFIRLGGMAKETAHQLGTPISSLSGWTELLKQPQTEESRQKIIAEISHDIDRLSKVAQRFSQIGSNSGHHTCEVNRALHETVEYFRRRLPQSGKAIIIEEDYRITAECTLNRDLFEWTVENLIKNGLDAIEKETGTITISLDAHPNGKWIIVDVTDTGKGITKQHLQQIFKPGFSTKKRGWGLGLNLAKRIAEDYHKGKLFVKSTGADKGTTMRLLLKGGASHV